jgi:hypothetical protein
MAFSKKINLAGSDESGAGSVTCIMGLKEILIVQSEDS